MLRGGAPRAAGPLAAMALLVLAGCASTPQDAGSSDSGSTIRSDVVDDVERAPGDGEPAQEATTGRVSGIILHPSGFPLSGALVTILNVDHSVMTAADGAFSFQEVHPGSQLLRVEKEAYQTLQRTVEVVAGKLTRVEVVLVPEAGSDPGFAEHIHQHWRGQDTYQVFEGTVALSDDIEQVPPAMCVGRTAADCTTLFIHPPEGRIIPPGTAKVTVDVSFEPGALFDQETMRLHIVPPVAGSNAIDDRGLKTGPGQHPITSGQQTFEFLVEDPGLTDHGHAHWTDWQFYITWEPATGSIGGDWYNALFRSPVDVTITAHKGELTLDPPYQRYWKESDTLEMSVSEPSFAYCSVVPGTCLVRPADVRPWTFGDATSCQYGCMTLAAGDVVPPGTTRVQFEVEQYWGDEATVAAAAAAYERNPFKIGYRTAAAPPHHATWDNYTWPEPLETTTEGGTVRWSFEVEVQPHETDPYYQRTSRWILMPAVPGNEDAETWEGIECPFQACGYAWFRLLSFTAINDNWDEMMLAGAV